MFGDVKNVELFRHRINVLTVDLKDLDEVCNVPAMVLVVIRAYPKELTENMLGLATKVQNVLKEKGYEVMKWEAVDIAFGYKALDLYILIPEEQERGTDDAEEAIKSVDEIDNVDVVYITRLSI